MGAVTNGMLLHGGLRPFRRRPRIQRLHATHDRLAALTIFQHFYLHSRQYFPGEDGPTHRRLNITGIAAFEFRLLPTRRRGRGCDGLGLALRSEGTLTSLGLTRQGLPAIERDPGFDIGDVARGGHVVSEHDAAVTLVGTSSELHVCRCGASTERVRDRGVVVSMPSVDLSIPSQPRTSSQSSLRDSRRI